MTGRKNYTSQATGKAVSRQANYFTKKLREMEYSTHLRKPVTLARGKYAGYPFIVINRGTHPTAYICLPDMHPLTGMTTGKIALLDVLDVHGGVTYAEPSVSGSTIKDRWWIGWDYAHLSQGDYMDGIDEVLLTRLGAGHKWTTDEILQHVKSAIAQLQKIDK